MASYISAKHKDIYIINFIRTVNFLLKACDLIFSLKWRLISVQIVNIYIINFTRTVHFLLKVCDLVFDTSS